MIDTSKMKELQLGPTIKKGRKEGKKYIYETWHLAKELGREGLIPYGNLWLVYWSEQDHKSVGQIKRRNKQLNLQCTLLVIRSKNYSLLLRKPKNGELVLWTSFESVRQTFVSLFELSRGEICVENIIRASRGNYFQAKIPKMAVYFASREII